MQKYDEYRIQAFTFQEKLFYVKRDELLDPLLSGNKYWKLYTLMQAPKERYRKIISYGGTQSNAMLSIAALCNQKGWEFHYTCKPVGQYLRNHAQGNLKKALHLGMVLHEVSHHYYAEQVAQLRMKHANQLLHDKTVFVPQGGADALAELGIKALAKEIRQWQQSKKIGRLNIVLPSGTGTTAYYLAKHLPEHHVITTAVVGDAIYLQSQMQLLGVLPKNISVIEGAKKYHFAKPYAELLALYHALAEAGIIFDLIYATVMWQALLQHIEMFPEPVLYVHSGGLMGNESMLARYKRQRIF